MSIRRKRLQWALGSVGTGTFSTVPSLLLLYFLTATLAVPMAYAVVAVFVPKAASLLIDPWIGRLSDRHAARGRRPFLLVGAVAAGLTLAALFGVPSAADPRLTAALVGAIYLASVLAFAIFAVPYIAMPPNIEPEPEAQLRLIGLRMVFVTIGIIVGGALGPVLVDAGGGGTAGYRFMGVMLGLVVTAAMLVAALADVERPVTVSQSLGGGPLPPGFVSLLGFYFCAQAAAGCGSAALPYFIIGLEGGSETELGLRLLLMLGTGAMSAPVWGRYAGKVGAAQAVPAVLGFLLLGYGLCSASVLSAQVASVNGFAAGMVCLGIGSTGVQVIVFGQLAALTSGEDGAASRAGQLTGYATAIEKLALASGPLLAGGTLLLFGVNEGALREADRLAVLFALAAVPALLTCLAAVIARHMDTASDLQGIVT
jgi:Na+/melibiose symporter-like transporter